MGGRVKFSFCLLEGGRVNFLPLLMSCAESGEVVFGGAGGMWLVTVAAPNVWLSW